MHAGRSANGSMQAKSAHAELVEARTKRGACFDKRSMSEVVHGVWNW
jgi:hypothetical protein